MLFGVFLGTLVVVSCFSWPVIWIGLELNLIAFIPFALSNNFNKKCAIIYFVSQSCGSLMVLIGGLMLDRGLIIIVLVTAGIVVKIGLMPLHFWVPSVVVNIKRLDLYLLLSWQKIGPLVIILSASARMSILSVFNAVCGSVIILGVSVLPLFLVFRGMVQIGWVLFTSGSFTYYYLLVYFLVLSSVVAYRAVASSLQFGWALLNAGGLPPFSGFMIKLKAILHIKSSIVVVLVGASGLALASYVRVLLNTCLKTGIVSPFFVSSMAVGIV